MTDLTNPIYNNEDAARAHFEALRWADGRVCPHCGTVDNSTLLAGKSTRAGVYKCKDCRKPFSATIGTVYERSHIPLHKWLLATHLMVSSKKGISAAQLHRNLGFGSYRTAWFMAHRIREAMRDDTATPMGGPDKHVEVDETYTGKKDAMRGKTRKAKGGAGHKVAVLSLVERGGRVRSFHIENADKASVNEIVRANISRESILQTDESRLYGDVGPEMARHERVKHSAGEYVRGDAYTNTVENYFSVFKRGMKGVYQHCRENHLHRYLAEFDFRYSEREALGVNDTMRAAKAVRGTVGKRLTYHQPRHGNGRSLALA